MREHTGAPEEPRSRPTLDTVAEAAGVSRMTVSNAYNRPDQLSEQTRRRVLQVAAELGYGGPDPAGRSLRRGRSGTVGVVLTDHLARAFGDPGMVAFLHGLATTLGEAGQALLLLPVTDVESRQQVRDAVVDGFVLVSMPTGSPVVEEVLGRRLPVVTAGSLRLEGAPNVGADGSAATAELARHLLALGHRRLGLVTVVGGRAPGSAAPATDDGVLLLDPEKAPSATPHGGFRRRVEAHLRVLAEGGIRPEDVSVVGVRTNDRAHGRAAAELLLAQGSSTRPTAVACVTDILALGVLDAAGDLGLHVPDDLSVVGFDGIEEAERSHPPLATVRQDLFEQGRTAAKLLLSRLAGGRPRSVSRTAEVVLGGTTAAAPVPRRRS